MRKKLEKKLQTVAQPLYVCSSVCIFVTESCVNRLDISIEFLKFVKLYGGNLLGNLETILPIWFTFSKHSSFL